MTDYERLLNAPMDELLAEIGRAASPDLLGPRAFHEAVKAGQAWFTEHIDEVRAAVCAQRERLMSGPRPVDIVAAIADVLASIKGIPALATVAVLVYRYGLDNFCGEDAA